MVPAGAKSKALARETARRIPEFSRNFWRFPVGREGATVISLSLSQRLRYPFWSLVRKNWRPYSAGLLALMLVDIINVSLPLAMREAIDAISRRETPTVLVAAGGILFLMLVQSGLRYLWRIFLIGTSHRLAKELRTRLYSHLQSLPLHYYQSVHTGDLMSRATNDIESVRMALGPGILVTVDSLLMIVLIVPVMAYLSPKLTLLAFTFYPLVPILTARLGDRIDRLFERLQARMSRLSSFTQETLSAIRQVKSLVLESAASRRFEGLSEDYRSEGIRLARQQAVFSPTLSLITQGGTFLILLVGGLDVMEGALTVGTFIAFQRFVVQLSWPMEAIGWAVTMNREGFAAKRRLDAVFAVPAAKSQLRSPRPVPERGLAIPSLGFRLPDSSFSLHLADLKVPPGAKVGLVGPTGSGKSTLLQLVIRLHEPPENAVLWNGVDVGAIAMRKLRREIGSVEQQVYLFSETVAANLLMGCDDESAGRRIERACETSCIRSEIERLPEGYLTRLGEKGVTLSGGQKQRLALARALVREPQLLLLDDCFSAVDAEVEQEIIARMLSDHPSLSLIVASHRLSIMPRLDEIWVLDGGSLTARGTHAELIERSALYRRLWLGRARPDAASTEALT